ncbi:MAG: CopG family transcriptional regulator [Leptospiraceae bacterium]|nr:CopG family transcriptional regulator [Leptospiraceae bacterium]MCK6382431.1 CopG family transcriptional regulator [Leptospiraceae bacterium]NUM40846.1 CopG family transcriptional regulator [Leptospiraceae bacterium]
MAKINKRFHLLLTDEELLLLKNESEKRNISAGELIRISLKNEIIQKSSYMRISALQTILGLVKN